MFNMGAKKYAVLVLIFFTAGSLYSGGPAGGALRVVKSASGTAKNIEALGNAAKASKIVSLAPQTAATPASVAAYGKEPFYPRQNIAAAGSNALHLEESLKSSKNNFPSISQKDFIISYDQAVARLSQVIDPTFRQLKPVIELAADSNGNIKEYIINKFVSAGKMIDAVSYKDLKAIAFENGVFNEAKFDDLVRLYRTYFLNIGPNGFISPDVTLVREFIVRSKPGAVNEALFSEFLLLRKKAFLQDTDLEKAFIGKDGYLNEAAMDKFLSFIKLWENKSGALLKKNDLSLSKYYSFFLENAELLNQGRELMGDDVLFYALDSTNTRTFKNILNRAVGLKQSLAPAVYENLLQKINPAGSKSKEALSAAVTDLKKGYLTKEKSGQEDIRLLQNQINTKTSELRNLLKNGTLLHPHEKINIIKILSEVSQFSGGKRAGSFVDNILPGVPFAQWDGWKSALEKEIFKKAGVAYNKNLADKINITASGYLNEIALGDREFYKEFSGLLRTLDTANTPRQDIIALPKNIETKKQLESFGVNFDKWAGYDENIFINYRVPDYSPQIYNGIKLNGQTIKVAQADMYDIKNALTLGNKASCCTAVGGLRDFASKESMAVKSITNKLVAHADITIDGKYVGNSVFVLAHIEGKSGPVLLHDNTELLEQYARHPHITNAVARYMKKLAAELGKPEMELYSLHFRHAFSSINFKAGERLSANMAILGSSGKDEMFFESAFARTSHIASEEGQIINGKTYSEYDLVKITGKY